MTRRDIVARFKGSFLGCVWLLLNPLIMLTIYTFVFSIVFKARFNDDSHLSNLSFATNLFVGLIIHSLISEVLSGAPKIILSNANYVKKVIFPLEILSIISLRVSLFNAFVSICALLIVFFLLNGYINWTVIFIPLVIIPFLPLILGLAWIIASLGVYMRDIDQFIGIILTVLLFLCPIFYPLSSLPMNLQGVVTLNPLTLIVEQLRDVVIYGHLPDLLSLSKYLVISSAICWLGFIWFQKTRKGFADVL
ncbi:ABC transporter permease [Francisella salimarina]|uniref:Transport permease protein n=2 Tax=Francisella TaxID=262 RepID=A0AAJ4NP43_9GAMM|nr:ABC transporter permease [Francisella salimarina]QWU99353.1 ABC transporter permease [Francisella salimarina]